MRFTEPLFILYVRDQQRSRDFYAAVLDRQPSLDVEGMTEFALAAGGRIGLMPQAGIARLLNLDSALWTDGLPPRCELYLRTPSAAEVIDTALRAGARLISPLAARDWGEQVAYLADPDGHIVAIASLSTVG